MKNNEKCDKKKLEKISMQLKIYVIKLQAASKRNIIVIMKVKTNLFNAVKKPIYEDFKLNQDNIWPEKGMADQVY